MISWSGRSKGVKVLVHLHDDDKILWLNQNKEKLRENLEIAKENLADKDVYDIMLKLLENMEIKKEVEGS
jgi:hypothetical protein